MPIRLIILNLIVLLLYTAPISASTERGVLTYLQLQGLNSKILNHAALSGNLPKTQVEFEALLDTHSDIGYPMDGMGYTYRYRYPSVNPKRAFDLYSVGLNGIDENSEGDDIVAWESRKYYRSEGQSKFEILFILFLVDGPLLFVGFILVSLYKRYRRSKT